MITGDRRGRVGLVAFFRPDGPLMRITAGLWSAGLRQAGDVAGGLDLVARAMRSTSHSENSPPSTRRTPARGAAPAGAQIRAVRMAT